MAIDEGKLEQEIKSAFKNAGADVTVKKIAEPVKASFGEELCAHSISEGAGTKATGYALPEMGPFKCGNCVHFDSPDLCDHKDVIADVDVPKTSDSKHAIVKPESCCNYFHPKDKA